MKYKIKEFFDDGASESEATLEEMIQDWFDCHPNIKIINTNYALTSVEDYPAFTENFIIIYTEEREDNENVLWNCNHS